MKKKSKKKSKKGGTGPVSKLLLDLDELKKENKPVDLPNIKSLETYIYLNDLSLKYNDLLNDVHNSYKKELVINKINEKTNYDWGRIIKFKGSRSYYLKKNYNIDEEQLISELQGLQTTDIIHDLREIPSNFLKYLSRRNEYSNRNSKPSKFSQISKRPKFSKGPKFSKTKIARGKKNKLKAIDTRKKRKKDKK